MKATRRTLFGSTALIVGLAGSLFASGTASAGLIIMGPHSPAITHIATNGSVGASNIDLGVIVLGPHGNQ